MSIRKQWGVILHKRPDPPVLAKHRFWTEKGAEHFAERFELRAWEKREELWEARVVELRRVLQL